ncbi:NUDIX domain-containing protein [Candidatus Amesbacteria bacterium]|nr:NUDIX domain-containing protein [Candidatus Amesbacteria bacterium]
MTDKTNTPDEIVDVVNEQDEVIGQSTKGEVNSNPNLIHREVTVLIYDAQNRILIQQRSRNKKTNPTMWILSVAGHVKSGQTYEQAAHAELQEELGFDTDLKLYEKQKFSYENETQFTCSYLGKVPRDTKIEFDSNETEQIMFIDEKGLDKMIESGEKIEEYSLSEFRKFFGKHLMEKRLCACVNIFPNMLPMFWWPPKENKIDHAAPKYYEWIKGELK